MDTVARTVVSVALLVAGAVLALLLPDTEFLWFQGRPLGVVLVIVGLIDLGELAWDRRRREVG